MLLYIGGYANEIPAFRMDPNSGALTPLGVAASGVKNPSFLAVHPSRRFLYAVAEVGEINGVKGGGVLAFAIDEKNGKLTPLNQESSQGGGPCHISIDKEGKNALVANYGGGSVACLPIGRDGKLSPASAFIQHKGSSVNKSRQEGPHAHSINPDAASRFAVAADLGMDKLLVYRFDPAKGTLAPNDPPAADTQPGAGPRHFAFHPSGRYAYAIHELSNKVTAYRYDGSRGTLTEIETLPTLPEGFKDTSYTAEVQVHPSGRFLYGSNRGHDSIAVFAIDGRSGRLRPVGHTPTQGKFPRHFGIDPSGRFLIAANQESGNLVVFRINQRSGALTPTGHTAEATKPVCVRFVPV